VKQKTTCSRGRRRHRQTRLLALHALRNEEVIDPYGRGKIGTKVTVTCL